MDEHLKDVQISRGARFTHYAGHEIAADFGDVPGEYRAIRESAGILDLSWHSVIRFTGSERASFLHGMTTNHVNDLAPLHAQHNTVCNVTGHLEGVVRLVNSGDALWADMHPACLDGLVKILDKHLIMEDVQIAVLDAEWGVVSVQGPKSAELLAMMGFPTPDAGVAAAHSYKGFDLLVVGESQTGERGADVIVPREALPSLWESLAGPAVDLGGSPVGLSVLQQTRVEAGIPWWSDDLNDTILMLEAGLPDAIHFSKGCYLGQETLSRVHFRGHTNRQLIGIKLAGDMLPAGGTRLIKGDKPAGWTTTAVRSPRMGQPIALGFVRSEYLAAGTVLRTETGQEATVCDLPFEPGEGSS